MTASTEPDSTTATTDDPDAPSTTPATTTTPTTPTAEPAVTTTTTIAPAPTFNFTIAGQFVGPVFAGGTAGLQVDLSVAAAPGGPGSARPMSMRTAAATIPTEVRLTLPAGVTFAAIDDGWICAQADDGVVREAVCTSAVLEHPGNASILVRVAVDAGVLGTVTIPYEVVTPDGRHIVGAPALATVTSAAAAGNPVFAAVDHGDLALAGNALMTCDVAQSGCTDAQAGLGANVNNNSWNMRYVDVDSDVTTFDSSRSTLSLPLDAEVLFAGLRWSGDTAAGFQGTADRVVVTGPVGASSTVVADRTVATTLDSSRYISMADVTALVQSGGAGTYTVGNVAASTGANKYAGWALVVAYRSASAPTRMLLVRDTSETDTWTIPRSVAMSASITGLPSVVDGRKASIGVVAFEGDQGLIGDSVTANGSVLSNTENPATNVFNSSIVLGLGRDPATVNTFGVDVDRFDTTVPVRPDHVEDHTSVTFTFNSTGGDQVYLATIVLVVDLAEAP
jgi:hypothetical protein